MIPNQNAKDLIDRLKINPFIDGPTESLVKACAQQIAAVPEWRYIFRDNIDTYERFDYSIPQLPALRIYNQRYRKEQESHYITGELNVEAVLPASLRRHELQSFQDIISAALLQQFRRPGFFATMLQLVPGLNELGKTFDVDKEKGMVWEEEILPMTIMRPNFRIDLKVWDSYLEEQGRTKDDPFNATLKDLKTMAVQIIPVLDDSSPVADASVHMTVKIGG